MEKIIINVPKAVRFISDWSGFELPENPSIINKQITGCGFTEWCIRNKRFTVLCSPRKILLENKSEQHPGEVFYVKNDLDKVLNIDTDLNSSRPDVKSSKKDNDLSEKELCIIKDSVNLLKNNIYLYYFNCVQSNTPCKILVTYDSFRHVKDALGERIDQFDIIVDEFQSIFTDSKFKSDTELEFLNYLRNLKKVYFVSATPMMDRYLDLLDEFKDLPYYELDWKAENPGRVVNPQLSVKSCQRILDSAERIIKTYLDGKFEKYTYLDDYDNPLEIESRELVIYVNSVKNICDIIRRNGLTLDNTNILCANTPENQKKLRSALGISTKVDCIGTIPKKGEPHKMFTLCTRTVYLGADFYSTCARTLILSDANIDCLAVDITLDLPQILGRQRLEENPWKNRAELYFKSTLNRNIKTVDELKKLINLKQQRTESLLLSYNSSPTTITKHYLAENYQYVAKTKHYKDDYVAVNTHGGKDLIPTVNSLVMISEIRAFEIQQIDYKDRFNVFKSINNTVCDNPKIKEFLDKFESLSLFPDKMKLLCELTINEDLMDNILDAIPIIYKNFYNVLGKDRIKMFSYQKYLLQAEYDKQKSKFKSIDKLSELIYDRFTVGNKYTNVVAKSILKNIYLELEILGNPKATDLYNYFELKICKVSDPTSKKRENGIEIIKKKE